MSEIETEVAEIDPINAVYEGECLSVSGRSTLTFAIGKHQDDGTLHLRIADNSGKGMWFDGWASAAEIDKVAKGATELTARSFHCLHPGRSINTGGFVLAALKELGLIRANSENTRLHEHVPSATFEKVATDAMRKNVSAKKTKATRTNAGEG